MIKFFRKIRQKLLEQSKIRSYFVYAFGEIVLVVIGILIALQVSNWNTNRIEAQEEQRTIKNLHTEFLRNQKILETSINETKNSINTGRYIMSLINTDLDYLKTQKTDSLLFNIFEIGAINVTENTVLEILQSGKLKNLKNNTLKLLIFDWTQKKTRIVENRKSVDEKTNYLINYLMKRYPLKNIDAFGVLNWKNPSNIKVDKYQIFYDLEFENIIDDLLYNLVNYNRRLEELQKTVISIVENSKT